MVTSAAVIDLKWAVQFFDAPIKGIEDDTCFSQNLPSRTRETLVCYVRLAKLLFVNAPGCQEL